LKKRRGRENHLFLNKPVREEKKGGGVIKKTWGREKTSIEDSAVGNKITITKNKGL